MGIYFQLCFNNAALTLPQFIHAQLKFNHQEQVHEFNATKRTPAMVKVFWLILSNPTLFVDKEEEILDLPLPTTQQNKLSALVRIVYWWAILR